MEKIMTGAGIEPTTSDYIRQCSKPLSYRVNKIVAIDIQQLLRISVGSSEIPLEKRF